MSPLREIWRMTIPSFQDGCHDPVRPILEARAISINRIVLHHARYTADGSIFLNEWIIYRFLTLPSNMSILLDLSVFNRQFRPAVLQVWSPEHQQQQHHLGTCYKYQFTSSIPDLRNQRPLGGGVEGCRLQSEFSEAPQVTLVQGTC